MTRNWVLSITKRTAELCATQPLLYLCGLELVTATSLEGAQAAMKSLDVKAVILCKHSWSEEERNRLASQLQVMEPRPAVLMRCPGCDEEHGCSGRRGKLTNFVALNELINRALKS